MRLSYTSIGGKKVATATFELNDFPKKETLVIPGYAYIPESYHGESSDPYLTLAFNNALASGVSSMAYTDSVAVVDKSTALNILDFVSSRFSVGVDVFDAIQWRSLYQIVLDNKLNINELQLCHYLVADYYNPASLPFKISSNGLHAYYATSFNRYYFDFIDETFNDLPSLESLHKYRILLTFLGKISETRPDNFMRQIGSHYWHMASELTVEDYTNLNTFFKENEENKRTFHFYNLVVVAKIVEYYIADRANFLDMLNTMPESWIQKVINGQG